MGREAGAKARFGKQFIEKYFVDLERWQSERKARLRHFKRRVALERDGFDKGVTQEFSFSEHYMTFS